MTVRLELEVSFEVMAILEKEAFRSKTTVEEMLVEDLMFTFYVDQNMSLQKQQEGK